MRTKFFENEMIYTGEELRPHWLSQQLGEYGDAMVAFIGPCKVPTESLVDLEDRDQGACIESKQMLHFIAEQFAVDLNLAVAQQRLFTALMGDLLRQRLPARLAHSLERKGDDLFVNNGEGQKKLTVSIVTASGVSTLLHFGVNIDATGAPVAAIGLKDLDIDAREFAQAMLEAWSLELQQSRKAICKVVPR